MELKYKKLFVGVSCACVRAYERELEMGEGERERRHTQGQSQRRLNTLFNNPKGWRPYLTHLQSSWTESTTVRQALNTSATIKRVLKASSLASPRPRPSTLMSRRCVHGSLPSPPLAPPSPQSPSCRMLCTCGNGTHSR